MAHQQLPLIDGLTTIPNFITESEASELIKSIDQQEWFGDGKQLRRVQQYGVVYDYKTHQVNHHQTATPFPEWLKPIIQRLEIEKHISKPIKQVFINEYVNHQGIGPHIDSLDFGPEIISITLQDGCPWTFTRDKHASVTFMVPALSLLVLSGDARYKWKHEIPYSKLVHWVDPHTKLQQRFKRHKYFRRISLTFRSNANFEHA